MRLDCTPRSFEVIPGEPMRLHLTVQADSAMPFRWHVPTEPLLKLRAIEKLPVRRTREGVVVYQRVLVWQGLEPGTVNIKTLSVSTKDQKLRFPGVTITIRDPNAGFGHPQSSLGLCPEFVGTESQPTPCASRDYPSLEDSNP